MMHTPCNDGSKAQTRYRPNPATKTLLAVCWLMSSLVLGSLALAEEPPVGGTPKDFQLPEIHTFELDNGVSATLVPFGEVPKVQMRVVVRTGNIDETADNMWLADLTGRFMEEGAGTLDAAGLAEAFAALGGQLQIGVGVDTTFLSSGSLSELAPELVRLLAKVVAEPSLPADSLDRLKKEFARRLAVTKTQAAQIANESFRKALYGDHPYGRSFPSEELVQGYTKEQAAAFHHDQFGALRTHIYVVGVFDREAVEQAVAESFGTLPAGKPPTTNPPVVTDSARVILIDRPGAPQSTLRLGLTVVDPSHPDYMALWVTNALLGGSFSSRITANIREDKGYTYSPVSMVRSRNHSAHWAQMADVTTADTGAAIREIRFEIERLQQEPPSAAELTDVQTYLAGSFVRTNSNPFGIAYQLYYVDLHGLGQEHLTTYVQRVFAVTPEDVQRVAQTYLRGDAMTLVVVGDEKTVKPQLQALGLTVQ